MPEIGNHDELTLNIDEMLQIFCHTPSTPSIYRVGDCLRSTTKEKAYDPMIISIGPLHHGKEHLKAMEHLKVRYLKQLVGDSSVDTYVNAIRKQEQTARNFYAEEIGLDADDFVKMLLLDGIFIIEFLREYSKLLDIEKAGSNPIFGFEHVVSHVLRDLVLFENQIPMPVIEELFKLSNHGKKEFKNLLWPLLSPHRDVPTMLPKASHLLGLVHSIKCCSFAPIPEHGDGETENIQSATELKEAGVVFKKPNNSKTNWLDITFKNKTVYIPEIEIDDVSESWLRNMIAYEYYFPRSSPRYISDYAFFLHCLMSSSKDAEVLRRCGVISNCLGGDGRVYEVVDRLGNNVHTSRRFSYLGVFGSINRHCRLKSNRWLAVLRRHHFNNPWTAISLFAAALLLSLGILQTLYTVLTFYRK